MSNWYSGETQIRWACRELLAGKEISHACEIAAVRGWRLSAIIYNLKHRYKWPILTRKGINNVAFYRLGQSDIDALEKPRSYYKKENGQ